MMPIANQLDCTQDLLGTTRISDKLLSIPCIKILNLKSVPYINRSPPYKTALARQNDGRNQLSTNFHLVVSQPSSSIHSVGWALSATRSTSCGAKLIENTPGFTIKFEELAFGLPTFLSSRVDSAVGPLASRPVSTSYLIPVVGTRST